MTHLPACHCGKAIYCLNGCEPEPLIDWEAVKLEWNKYTNYMRPYTVEWFKRRIEQQLKNKK